METNVHHTFFNRAWYRTPILRSLRNHPLVKTSMLVDIHRELHAEVQAPPKPSHELAVGALYLLNDLYEDSQYDSVNAHLALSEYFLGKDNSRAQRIGHNILRQTVYIAESQERMHEEACQG